jgi:glycosyltransferase involved in cell wall biosynthesis
VEVEKSKAVLDKMVVAEPKPFVVVGVPAFNEEKTIARVVLESQRFADKVVVCDDGSSDLTGAIAERLGAEVVWHERNMGYGAAIQSLFKKAREQGADILVTLDGDGQHNPADVPKLVKPIVEGVADIVIGSRLANKRSNGTMPWYRRAGVRFITALMNNSSKNNVKDSQSGFRAYSRTSLESLVLLEDGMGVSAEILIKARNDGLKIVEVLSIPRYGKDVDTSTHNPVRHGASVVATIVKLVIEDKPLTMLGIPGILCLAMGTAFGLWMLQIYSLAKHIVTNIALASIGFLLIGFFCLSTAVTLYAIRRLVEKIEKAQ